jgi:hypothetical protein
VRGNSHARFCSRGVRGDPRIDCNHFLSRHYTKACRLLTWCKCPWRYPVDATHMASEKGGHQQQCAVRGNVCRGDQGGEHVGRYPIRRRLEVFPAQKDAHRAEASSANARKVTCDLGSIQVSPPIHGACDWPVVDAETKGHGRAASGVRP